MTEQNGVKISCLPVSLFPELSRKDITLAQWARIAGDIGLDGFDISIMFVENHTPVYLRELKEQLDDAGLPLVMAAAYPDFTHIDAMQRRRELAYVRRDIAVCSALGAKYMRVLAGQAHPGISRGDGVKWAVEGLTQAAQTAAEFGVQLLYENHAKPGTWDYTDFSTPPGIFLEIYEAIKETGIRVNFDTGNPVAYGVDPLTQLEQVIDRVETLHIADMRAYGSFEPVLIGTGEVPFTSIFSMLKAHGFHGWLCIEEASFGGLEGIREAVSAVRDLWKKA